MRGQSLYSLGHERSEGLDRNCALKPLVHETTPALGSKDRALTMLVLMSIHDIMKLDLLRPSFSKWAVS